MNRRVDVIIVGGGIAGTALAWTLLERGRSFVLLDNNNSSSASRVAAGLVTPITGRRLNRSFQWASAYTHSDLFYRRIEERIGDTFWYRAGAARLCDASTPEYETRARLEQFPDIDTVWMEPNWFDQNLLQNQGGFFMPQASRLDVQRFLSASHGYFDSLGAYIQEQVDLDEDLFIHPQNVYYRPHDISAAYAICCRGVVDRQHRFFERARFNPAQGDILQIRFARPLDTITLHANWWMTPVFIAQTSKSLAITDRPKSADWLLGSTYQWRPLDGQPSPEGRDSLLQGLRQRVSIPAEVVDHRAAVRPSSFDQKPLMGLHDEFPRLGLLNGLGAKGCYLAPWCASLLADEILDGKPIPSELRWNR